MSDYKNKLSSPTLLVTSIGLNIETFNIGCPTKVAFVTLTEVKIGLVYEIEQKVAGLNFLMVDFTFLCRNHYLCT